jgi:CMP-N-acetylneuraminic acid synthetase
MNGAIYACLTPVLFGAEPSLYGERVVAYRMPAERSISIDDLADWAEAERALAARHP